MKKLIQILTAALAAVFLLGCQPAENDGRQVVAVSTPAVGRIVSEIVGDEAEVVVLLPPGSDPENYEPDMATMKRLAKADAFISLNTPGFEQKIAAQLAATMPDLPQADLSAGIPRLQESHAPLSPEHNSHSESSPSLPCDGGSRRPHPHADGDPHLLSSPANALTVTSNAIRTLSSIYPTRAETFARNGELFSSQLKVIVNRVGEQLAGAEGTVFVVTHPSLSYFARDYGLTQLALEQDGKEVTPRQLTERLAAAREGGAVAVFYEQSHSPRQARQAARELNLTAHPIDFNAADFPDQYLRVAAALHPTNP